MKSLFDRLLPEFIKLKKSLTANQFDTYAVAYSGGLDSSVLLHLSLQISKKTDTRLKAIHINHGLSPLSDQWAQHCQSVCQQENISLQVIGVNGQPSAGESPEAAARHARYSALKTALSSNELLLFAQHQDDQAETLLLQLLRGAGPKGLASMAVISDFGKGKLYRPFLDVEQKILTEYAKLNKLQWVEDDSNHNTKFDRNYLRHQVIPQIKQRWPSMATTLSRSARLCAQAAHLESCLGAKLLPEVLGDTAHIIHIDRLRQYETHEQTLIIRHWVEKSGRQVPNEKHIRQLFGKVLNARTDATPVLTWQAGEIRRYKRHLYLMSPITQPRINHCYRWVPTRPLPLPCIGKQLDSKYVLGEGLDTKRCEGGFEVLFRLNGEQCIGKDGRLQSLKKILQNLDIPPWERYRLPLLIDAGHVIAVGAYWVSPEYQAQKDQWGYKLMLS